MKVMMMVMLVMMISCGKNDNKRTNDTVVGQTPELQCVNYAYVCERQCNFSINGVCQRYGAQRCYYKCRRLASGEWVN